MQITCKPIQRSSTSFSPRHTGIQARMVCIYYEANIQEYILLQRSVQTRLLDKEHKLKQQLKV